MKKEIQQDKTQRKKLILICLVLAAAIIIAFEPVRHNAFISYDDDVYVTENPNVQKGLTAESIKWAFTSGYAANWHPLTWLSHMLDYQLYGNNPFYHHRTNVFFHILNSLLLLIIFKKATGNLWASVFAAAVFALHPLRVESVAWVAERKDVLSGFFWLLTIAAYFWYASRPCICRYLCVFLSLMLGLMAKPMLVSLPLILLLLDYWPLNRFELNWADIKSKALGLLAEKTPLFLLVTTSMVVTFLVQQKAGAMLSCSNFSLPVRIANALVVYIGYISKMLFPYHLAVLYPHPGDTLGLWKPVASLVLLLLITAVIFYKSKNYKFLVVGWLWYVIALLPVIGLVQVGEQAMADRYTYLTSIGFFIILILLIAQLQKKYKHITKPVCILAVVVIVAMTAATRNQLKYWKDDTTLFTRTIDVTEKNYIIHNNLGYTLYSKGQFDQAVELFDKALEFKPNYAKASNNKARVYLTIGKFDQAVKCLQQTVVMAPYWPDAYNNLGLANFLAENYADAEKNYKKAVTLQPDYPKAQNGLGKSLLKLDRIQEAIEAFNKAIQLSPNYADPYYFGAIGLTKLGQTKKAVEYLYKSVNCDSSWFVSINTLAWLLAVSSDASVRDPEQALILAKQACKLSEYKHCNCVDTLAAAYAANGDFTNAISTGEKALELAKKYNDRPLMENILKHLELFKKNEAISEP